MLFLSIAAPAEASDSLSHLHLLLHFVLLLIEQISSGMFLSVAGVPG